jgi:putative PEP-CTERM system histidine kinase
VFELPFRSPGVLAYGFGTLAFLGFAVQLGLGWRGGLKASALLATIAASALWAGLNLGFALTEAPALWSAQLLADALRIGGWLLFVVMVLGSAGAATRWGSALLLFAAASWFVPAAPPTAEFTPLAAPSRLPFGLMLGVAVAGLVLTEQVFRRALEQARWSVKPLCLGLGGGFVFDLYLYADALLFGRLDPDIWAARGFAQALVIPFIAVATARNKDWTIDIALSRGVVFHSTAFLASGVYLLAVAAAGYYVRYFGGSWGKTFQVGFIFAALLLLGWLFSSGTLRSKLKVFINKNFFSYRYDYRAEWLRFTQLLSARDANVSAAQRSIEALANLVESPAGALWLHDGDAPFRQAARWNLPEIRAPEPAERSLASFLRATGWVVDLREFRRQASRYPGLELPGWVESLPSAWLIVPIFAQDELLGFVVLATPRASIEVNWEVRDLLKTAARQVGSFLAQIQASEALLEARKFDAFNKMTAFVVHDLKNLVAQLSLLLKNAERHRQHPRFQADMLSTVKHVAERMNKLLVQLSSGERGEENLRPIHLGRLLERIAAAKANGRRNIEVHANAGDVVTFGYEQRFERVIGHLVENAIDATRDGGGIRLAVFAESSNAVVEVVDSGCGMSEEFLRQRFLRPFQTTKASGMGIGAYETSQYVKEMGGSIEADSRPGAGTRIKVILPLHRDPACRDEEARSRVSTP